MKKFLCWLLTASLLLALCACAPDAPPEEGSAPPAAEPERPPEDTGREDTPPEAASDYETVDWLVFSLTPEDYGIEYRELPEWPSFTLAELGTYCLYGDGAFAEGSLPRLYRCFMDAPDTVLHYLALIGRQTVCAGQPWERDAVETLCRGIACTDIFADDYYPRDMQRFDRIMEQYQELYPDGQIAEILSLLQAEHDASVERNGSPGYDLSNQSPQPVIPDKPVDWQVISLAPNDYGIVYDTDHMDVKPFPLAKLCVYYLYSDGAYAEGAHDELYRRFMEAPHTVLNFLALLGDQMARGGQTGELTAAAELCRAIAFADVFWHDSPPEFAAILEQYRELYPDGRIAKLLDTLRAEHDNAAAMFH